ncbi:MAG: AraC family transcriptional regulator [Saccharothrix sp.]|nr:AraC family transcriptional regulator [Saccharothrix sp.]
MARYWLVSWDYAEPYRQLVVPYPNVHLTFQGGRAAVHGVSSGHGVKVLEGRGHVVGAAFHPGAFRPFLRRSVSTITDRTIDATEVFGPLPADPEVDELEDFLRAHLPERDPGAEEAVAAVARVAAEPGITRVDALAAELDLGVRQVQRLFAEHVGVGPKWVIRRYRLHEVTERLAAGVATDWAALAADLGYTDQAHFIRDFRAMFGETPTHYAARY